MRVAIINNSGFDGGGATTLAIEYQNLGFDSYFRDITQEGQFKPNGNWKTYKDDSALIELSKQYDRFIFVPLTVSSEIKEKDYGILLKLREANPNIELCYIMCDRNIERFTNLCKWFREKNFAFDYIYAHNIELEKIAKDFDLKYEYIDFEAYTFPENIIKKERKDIVYTAGRVQGFKGVLRYFGTVENIIKDRNFKYIHEGAKINISSKGTYGCPMELMCVFDMSKHPKGFLPQYEFRQYGEEPVEGKFTLYPSYNKSDIQERWTNYFASICCILGSKSKIIKEKSLIGINYVAQDKRENTLLQKNSDKWHYALEYADLEKITYGLLLFSRLYANLIGFTDETLIYDSFDEIPSKLKYIKDNYNYNDLYKKEFDWFKDRQVKINEDIKIAFTKEFKKC